MFLQHSHRFSRPAANRLGGSTERRPSSRAGIMEAELLVLHHAVGGETRVDGDGRCLHRFGLPPGRPGARQVEDLHHVEHHRDAGHDQHEDDEDGFLRGPRHEALDGEGTWRPGADDLRLHDEPVQVILPHYEAYLQEDSEEDGGHVASQQVALELDFPLFVRVLWPLHNPPAGVGFHVFSQLFLFVVDMDDVAEVDQGWRGDEDDLENPEPNVRDGEGVVVADVLTTRLLSVANHFGLFITPNLQR